jgi:hypothetical protein
MEGVDATTGARVSARDVSPRIGMSRRKHPLSIVIGSLIVAGLAAAWLIRASSMPDESSGDATARARREAARSPSPAPVEPAETPPPLAPEPERKNDAEPSPDRTAVQTQDPLTPVAQTFRTSHPDLAAFEALLEQLAGKALLDPASIVVDASRVRASLTIPGYGLSGTLTEQRHDGRHTLMLHTPFGAENLPLHLSHVQVNVSFTYRDGKATGVRSELTYSAVAPRTSEGDAGWDRLVAALASTGSRTGYTMDDEGDRVQVTPWEISVVNDRNQGGRALHCQQATDQAFSWTRPSTRPYEAWGVLLDRALIGRRAGSDGK